MSSLTIRPRGMFFVRASISRQPASAFSRPRTAGLRLGSLSRFQASSGSMAKFDGIGELLHLLVEPFAAAGLLQPLQQLREDRREMRDVGDRIVDLPLVERAAAPVGEARTLVDVVAEHQFDEVGVADLLAMPERHRRDLRVEERVGDLRRSDCR